MRRHLSFDCDGSELAATLDDCGGATGLLIVSGGNETRSGAHSGMATLAARIASAGHPVFRFDRRGVGDSAGGNDGFEASAPDLARAVAAFRAAAPAVRRIVAFGNCDAATALALFHAGLGIDALVLSNLWVIETPGDLPPPAAIRARYRDKLTNSSEWLRLLRGGVDLRRVAKGLRTIAAKPSDHPLATRLGDALLAGDIPVDLIVAARDATALAFLDYWSSPACARLRSAPRFTVTRIDTASHSYARAEDADALYAGIVAVLERQA